jgi:hypothetical protein
MALYQHSTSNCALPVLTAALPTARLSCLAYSAHIHLQQESNLSLFSLSSPVLPFSLPNTA